MARNAASGWSYTQPVIFTLCVCVGVFILAFRVGHQRLFAGRHSFIGIHVACIWWLGAASLEMAFYASSCKMFWASMAWPAILAMSALWAVFLWQYFKVHSPHCRRGKSFSSVSMIPTVIWWVMMCSKRLPDFLWKSCAPSTQYFVLAEKSFWSLCPPARGVKPRRGYKNYATIFHLHRY